ncbi:hypothetical protein HPB51_002511 [Rhipicephalus microplus]|uniref:Serpin domain-containing protein n=1 Tax=Rhipicephalus microplus TaxID=6941 RepID=A0A9J6DEX3_RHIMP|nr:hypothetical protein HPB51_002511 [Rhipicephalus microplus]
MRRTGVLPYSYYHDLDADVVCLPYADGALSMALIAQRSSCSGSLKLTPDAVRGFVHGAVETLVTLHFPKFQLSTSFDMTDVINSVASANNYDSERLRFLHLRQEGRFSVDEGHWPAVSSERTSYAGAPVTVVVNKPFYFVITDKTSDLVLYAGKVDLTVSVLLSVRRSSQLDGWLLALETRRKGADSTKKRRLTRLRLAISGAYIEETFSQDKF